MESHESQLKCASNTPIGLHLEAALADLFMKAFFRLDHGEADKEAKSSSALLEGFRDRLLRVRVSKHNVLRSGKPTVDAIL